MSNAIKFTPSGGTVSVRVTQLPGAPEGKGAYELRVKDTGIGMSAEFAQNVFEPFEREPHIHRQQDSGYRSGHGDHQEYCG